MLQDVDVWYDSTKIPTTPHNNMTELYFEDNDIEGIIEKLESGKYVVSYVTELMELEGGQKLVRFYDPSGNLIEVRTPVNWAAIIRCLNHLLLKYFILISNVCARHSFFPYYTIYIFSFMLIKPFPCFDSNSMYNWHSHSIMSNK